MLKVKTGQLLWQYAHISVFIRERKHALVWPEAYPRMPYKLTREILRCNSNLVRRWVVSFEENDFFYSLCVCLVNQSCLILCNPMDCSLPGSSGHGILQARILERIAIPFSRGSSWTREWPQVSHTAGKFFTIWAIREAFLYFLNVLY